ncbi:MAG: tRNA (guanosine(37)-N1)-methyltransferase TrmD [Bacteroidota bacterium]
MRIDILTIFPDYFNGPFGHSIIKRAQEKKLCEIVIHDIRKFSKNKHKKTDDYPYGGEAGMVMAIQPIDDAISYLTRQRKYDEIIFLTPDADKLTQNTANKLSTFNNLLILCGHYKGIDQRVRDHLITSEISIGDYVLSGGETAAIVLVDTLTRLIPGVLSDETSALSDSFQDNLLSHPVYTRPPDYNGWKVPEILLSGNFKEIEKWKSERAQELTEKIRPDMLD